MNPLSAETNMFGVPLRPHSPTLTTQPSTSSRTSLTSEVKKEKEDIHPEHFNLIMRLLISVFILLIPGLFFLYVSYLALVEQGFGASIIPIVITVLLCGGGIFVLLPVIKKKIDGTI
jgi:hypothetical protein